VRRENNQGSQTLPRHTGCLLSHRYALTGLGARSFYQKYLGFLMAPSPNWFAAALFGLITYATYDLTNLAILKDRPVLLSIVDML